MTPPEVGTQTDCAAEVHSWGRGVVESHLQSRGRNDAARSIKSLVEEATGEYGGRFFVELLQNAHDAHRPASTGGRAVMLLDETEGVHGTVYAADTGRGFDYESFRAISNLALSNKSVGEGIGNKGVGFKSVLQICAAPEIYSSDPTDPIRDGYCFRFADENDIRAMVPDDDQARYVIDNVSLYTVPVPIEQVPEPVRQLRDDGYATVLRLPLRSPIAAQEARTRLDEMGASTVPVVLFLTRISELILTRRSTAGEHSQLLTRQESAAPPDWNGPPAKRVSVGSGQDFLVFSREVDRSRLQSALRVAVEAERLKEKWLGWTATAQVMLALPYGWESTEHRLYTYLPMGAGTRAPFPGHLHAPFYTDFARVGLDWSHPLNEMLLDVAGELAFDAAAALHTAASWGRRAHDHWTAVDLVCWEPDRISHLPRTPATNVPDAHDARVLPGRSGNALSLREAWLWPDNERAELTAEVAEVAAGLRCLVSGLGKARLARLRAAMLALDEALDLSASQLAQAVEAMSSHCLQSHMPVDRWARLYDDLAVLFAGPKAKSLEGRRVLLADDMTLRPCAVSPVSPVSRTKRAEATPFFPPVRQRTDDEDEVDADIALGLPQGLRSRLFFLHPDLTWYDDTRQQTRARKFLQDQRLVRRFEARALIDHIRAVAPTSTSPRLHRDTLRFVFDLQRSRSAAVLPLAEAGLRVMTEHGELLPASSTLFSHDWPDTNGADLETITLASADLAPELAALRSRLLPSPATMLDPADDRAAWVAFLKRLGVGNSLPVLQVQDSRPLHGISLRRDALARVQGPIPAGVLAAWTGTLPDRLPANYPQTPYRLRAPLRWLPGQDVADQLPVLIRAAYSRLVTASLGSWPDEHFAIAWERDRAGDKDPQRVSTPLGAFVTEGTWIRVHQPSQTASRYESVRNSWHFRAGTDAEPPRYTAIVHHSVREHLDTDAAALQRLRKAGLNVWNSPQDSGRLIVHLGNLLRTKQVDPAFVPHLYKAYRNAWSSALETMNADKQPAPATLVVKVGSDVSAETVRDLRTDRSLLVGEENDNAFLRRIALDFELPLLELDSRATEACRRLQRWAPADTVRRLSDLRVDVQLDGQDFRAAAEQPLLMELVPWLRPLLSILIEHRVPGPERATEQQMNRFLEHLSRIRVAFAHDVIVRVGDRRGTLPSRLRGVLPIDDLRHPTLVFQNPSPTLTWALLSAAADPLLQLMGRPRLATDLKLAIARLPQAGHDLRQQPSLVELADACDVDLEIAEQSVNHLSAGPAALADRLYPVLSHLYGPGPAKPLAGPSARRSEESLRQAVQTITATVNDPADKTNSLIAAAVAAVNIDDLRRRLNIPLADLNTTLAALDPPLPQIDYGVQHAETFQLGVLSLWNSLSQRLRWAFMEQHTTRDPIAGWVDLSNPERLRPLPDWARTVDSLTRDDILAAAINQLTQRAGQRLPEAGSALDPIDVVRRQNTTVVEDLVRSVSPVVHAWCAKNRVASPRALADPGDPGPVLNLLQQAGALDFVTLTAEDMLAWVQAVGVWPDDMPETTDLRTLSLTRQDLEKELSQEEQAVRERRQERRTIHVNGQPVDVGDGFSGVRRQLEAALAANPSFLKSRAHYTGLDPAPPARGDRGAGGAGTTGSSTRRASDSQLNAIGFAGEWLAYRWLATRYPTQFTDACWVSTNRRGALSGSPGDDSLGYDFVLPFQGGQVMFEVKATTGDGGELQLGESEVLAAQAHARNGRWRLLVVTHVLDDERRIRLLRNPFDPDSRGLYVFAGQGLRLRYQSADL